MIISSNKLRLVGYIVNVMYTEKKTKEEKEVIISQSVDACKQAC